MTNNVIQFPGYRKHAPPQTIEEVRDNIEKVRMELASEATHKAMIALFEALAKEGVDLTGDENIKDNALVCEAIKAAVCKSLTLNHNFHSMTEEMFTFEWFDEGMYSYTYKLPSEFDEEEEVNS